uniref:DUF5641 domain-containing protein n=1 Tax=Ascaris lumbricoides TaxID=6252 RepID=A0A0M3IPL4_ASCLU
MHGYSECKTTHPHGFCHRRHSKARRLPSIAAIIALREPSSENDKDPTTVGSRGKLLALWKAAISTIDRFWEIWTHEYLISLRERYRTGHKQPCRVTSRASVKSEIVIVAADGLPRAEWKLGKVEKVHKDDSGKTKAVDFRMKNGHVLKRPVNMLYPLEPSEEEKDAQKTPKSPKTPGGQKPAPRRNGGRGRKLNPT